MENSNYALVLTGAVLPGHATEAVWPALAEYFRMDAAKLDQLRARAPLTIKQSDDLGKLQTLQAGMAALGAEAELCAADGHAALFVLLDNAPRGPLPHVFVAERIDHGLWPDQVRVAAVGSQVWMAYRERAAPAVPPPAVARVSPAHESSAADAAATRVSSPLALEELESTEPVDGLVSLPLGAAIHAGFWRRCAALMIDGLLIGLAVTIVQVLLGIGAISAAVASQPDALLGVIGVTALVLFLGQWLYFALFESAAAQATPGKMALGIKVVDDNGRRIGFGRASGRYFGKILSGLIFNIGYLLAGWTTRKQALHDLMANTLVVFREVEPAGPLPTVRPPMPWYGWLLNMVLVGGCALAVLGFFLFAATMGQIASSALQGATGF